MIHVLNYHILIKFFLALDQPTLQRFPTYSYRHIVNQLEEILMFILTSRGHSVHATNTFTFDQLTDWLAFTFTSKLTILSAKSKLFGNILFFGYITSAFQDLALLKHTARMQSVSRNKNSGDGHAECSFADCKKKITYKLKILDEITKKVHEWSLNFFPGYIHKVVKSMERCCFVMAETLWHIVERDNWQARGVLN